jgi:hypothetical protein
VSTTHFGGYRPVIDERRPSAADMLKQMVLEDMSCVRRTIPSWRSAYTGTEVSRELIERWYDTRLFQFDDEDGRLLSKFLLENLFQRGIDPRALVRHICLRVLTDVREPFKWQSAYELDENMRSVVRRGRKDMVVTFSKI